MSLEKHSMVQIYLNTVCSQIKWREVHGAVKSELLSHLEETVQDVMGDGMSESEAIETAIHRMGDAADLGRQLQQTHVPQKNWPLVAAVALLSSLGLILMYLLEMSVSAMESSHIFSKSLIYTGIGTVMFLGMYFFDFRRMRQYASYLYAGTMLLWLAAFIIGQSINGRPFLVLGPVSIDYTSIAPYLLAVALAGIFTDKDWSNRKWLIQALILLAVPILFGAMSNNAPFLVMYSFVFVVLMVMSGARRIQLAVSLVCLFNMYKVFDGFSFTYIQSMDLWQQINSLEGTITAFHTDFVLLYYIKTFGWLAGIIIIALGAILLLRLVHAIRQIKDQYGSMTVGGLAVCFAIQMIWHVLMSLGLAPVVSMGLPFVSFGGSQMIVHLAAIGVILSIYKRKNLRSLPH